MLLFRSPRLFFFGLFPALLPALLSCAPSPTSVRVTVVHEESWQLSSFELQLSDDSLVLEEAAVDPSEQLLLLMPDTWAGQSLRLQLSGLRAGERWAHGSVSFTPVLGAETTVTVVLSRLPCGAWCKQGSTQCEGDGVVICEQRDEDQCMEWSAIVPCGDAAPFCSSGECRPDCFDECAQGESRCVGPQGARVCGDFDSDDCLEWSPASACSAAQVCSLGRCAQVCQDACEVGQTRCEGEGIEACGDRNDDGCLEWGPNDRCGEGESCQAGSCQPAEACSDECDADVCEGSSQRRCGNFDADACLELSRGTSCVPADLCQTGSCSEQGCQQQAVTCTTPPAPTCVDDQTLRTLEAVGSCDSSDGSCHYISSDSRCANGCQQRRCLGG